MNNVGRSIATSLFSILLLLLFLYSPAQGQGVTVGPDKTAREGALALPYAFYNTSFGAAAGSVYGSSGWPQKQATIVTTLIGGSNSALAFYGLARDVQSPLFTERLFLDADLALSTFGGIYSYTMENRATGDSRPVPTIPAIITLSGVLGKTILPG